MEEKEKIEELRSIYEEMDDEGKEMMILVVENYLSVHKSDHQKGKDRPNLDQKSNRYMI